MLKVILAISVASTMLDQGWNLVQGINQNWCNNQSKPVSLLTC
jgi:hypothetical protein